MKLLEDRIKKDGVVLKGNVLKVDSFLNHQIDVELMGALGKEFFDRFCDSGVTKILTIEASGIGIACLTAQYFGCKVVFAKKSRTLNLSGEVFSSEVRSFTHNVTNNVMVSKKFLAPEDRILIIDDFLANGCALNGLIDIVQQAGASIAGVGIVIEKTFQPGGDMIRSRGIRVESLAKVKSMTDDSLEFCD